MKGFLAFILLSAAVHAGILVGLPDDGMPEGQGDGGTDILSLAPADARIAALIAAWEAAPDVTVQPPMLRQPDPVPARHVLQPETAVARPASSRTFQPSPDARPLVAPAPPVALPRPDAIPTDLPNLSRPVVPQDRLHPVAPEPPRPRALPPRPTASATEAAQPRPDTSPHFDGATPRAAETSARPRPRPDDLSPPPSPPSSAPASQPQPPAPERAAAGANADTTRGAAPAPQPAPQPAISPAQVQSALATWGGQIQARIARVRPDLGASGRAVVQLTVAPNGQLTALGLAQSSGNAAVDRAALDTVRRAGRFPAAPAALTAAGYAFSVPLSFQ